MTELNDLLEMTEQPDYDLETFVNRARCFIKEGSRNFISMGGKLGLLQSLLSMHTFEALLVGIPVRAEKATAPCKIFWDHSGCNSSSSICLLWWGQS